MNYFTNKKILEKSESYFINQCKVIINDFLQENELSYISKFTLSSNAIKFFIKSNRSLTISFTNSGKENINFYILKEKDDFFYNLERICDAALVKRFYGMIKEFLIMRTTFYYSHENFILYSEDTLSKSLLLKEVFSLNEALKQDNPIISIFPYNNFYIALKQLYTRNFPSYNFKELNIGHLNDSLIKKSMELTIAIYSILDSFYEKDEIQLANNPISNSDKKSGLYKQLSSFLFNKHETFIYDNYVFDLEINTLDIEKDDLQFLITIYGARGRLEVEGIKKGEYEYELCSFDKDEIMQFLEDKNSLYRIENALNAPKANLEHFIERFQLSSSNKEKIIKSFQQNAKWDFYESESLIWETDYQRLKQESYNSKTEKVIFESKLRFTDVHNKKHKFRTIQFIYDTYYFYIVEIEKEILPILA